MGKECGGVFCELFELCEAGACVPYADCVASSMCAAAEICRNRFCIPADRDVDGDGSPAQTDCDESDPSVHPGATETCDLVDEDCDETIDEAVTQPCTSACGMGTEQCVGGAFTGCTAPTPDPETCDGSDEDCDGSTDEGLSRPCSTACGMGTERCVAGSFQMCDAPPVPAETCNVMDDDCDGRCDESVSGCRRGVHRSFNSSTGEHFWTVSRTEAACCGFMVERFDDYFLYTSMRAGLVPFYRCLLSSGFHFYTTSATCEGSPGSRMESIMGYIARSPTCGSTPLYRLVLGNDHLFTTSASERASAMSAGYRLEGDAGHVWTSP